MKPNELKRLKYRRQYLLSPVPVDCDFLHTVFPLTGTINLYAHVDLNVNIIASKHVKLVLLGDLYDYESEQKNNEDLLRDAIHEELNVFLRNISRYVGRFVVIYIKDENLIWITDAASSRKVFYYHNNEGVYCASNPHLLAKILHLEFTSEPSKMSFYGSEEFKRLNNANIGNTTCYDKLFQLIPNHYLDYNRCTHVRFWPNEPLQILPFNEVVDQSARIIKGYMNSIGYRNKIMLPVTGGKDSRLLLSATYDIRNTVFYYLCNDPRLNVKPYDITIPSSLFRDLGLEFNVFVPEEEVDNDFRKMFYENNPMACELFLPMIYNYYVNFSDRINLPGTFVNVVEDVYEVFGKTITPRILAELIHVQRFKHAETYFGDWLNGCQDLCNRLNFNVLNLLYWEERVANWGTQVQLDKDIAQEDIIPYNSRLLMQTMLSADIQFREKPEFMIFLEITRKLWPETLRKPCNPDFKTNVLKISRNLGIMKIIKSIYYRYIH